MALPADRLPSSAAAAPRTPVCTVHTCRRCKRSQPSADPCSFVVLTHSRVCPGCRAQEEASKHLPPSRTVWGASLASLRRAS
jgi:hypothetical protein